MRFRIFVVFVFLVAALGCDGESSGMDSGPSDEAEVAACRNLWTIDTAGGCASGANESECLVALTDWRTMGGTNCQTQYDAMIVCLTAQTACASGQQCPDEYTAFATCAGI